MFTPYVIIFKALAEQLVSEVKRLQQELAITKSKLQSASEMISKMPSEGEHFLTIHVYLGDRVSVYTCTCTCTA